MKTGDPAPPNFSLHIANDGKDRRPKEFHHLYRGFTSVIRTRDLRRLINAQLAYLSAFVDEGDLGSLQPDAVAFVREGGAVLAPPEIRTFLPSIERRLAANGLRVVDQPWARVDPSSGELLVTEPRLYVDRSVLDDLGDQAGRRTLDAAAPPGRYPILGWAFGTGVGERGPISRALAVTLAGAALRNRSQLGNQAALKGLTRVMERIVPVALWADRPEDLVDPLVALGRPAPRVSDRAGGG
ncbi:MAG: hypothetical protein M3144_01995 [Actinomycetota bacterium]|nr:hypothetical protein [Actinomycetota bacterium]